MGMMITLVVLVIIGLFVYLKFIQPMLSGKVGAAYAEADTEYRTNKEQILQEYYADPNRFALFKEVIPEEDIKGIASFAEPKKMSKAITEGIKTSITRVKKVNVDHFYMVITDKSLHAIEFNGENSVDHNVFDLGEIQEMNVGRVSMKDQMTGAADGNLVRLQFKYKDKDYSYNLYKTMFGYPRFKPVKDVISGTWGVNYFHDAGNSDSKTMMSKEGTIDSLVKHGLYEGFSKEIKEKYGATLPA